MGSRNLWQLSALRGGPTLEGLKDSWRRYPGKKVHQRVVCQLMITRAFSAGIIAFFTSLDILANMVSIGTLFAFFMVAAALFFYRLYDDKVSTKREGIVALVHLLLIVAASLGARSLLPASSA